jgi:hypothetical protein
MRVLNGLNINDLGKLFEFIVVCFFLNLCFLAVFYLQDISYFCIIILLKMGD